MFRERSMRIGVLALLAVAACGRTEPAPPEGSGVRAPVVAAGLAPDFVFRWPEPARAKVTMRLGEGDKAMAAIAELTLEGADAQGHRRLRMTPWAAKGGRMAGAFAALMQRYSEDGLVVRANGTTVDETAGAVWTRWVESWYLFADAAEGELKTVTEAELPPGLELRVLRKGVSALSREALELVYDLVALDERGRGALADMIQLQSRTAARTGSPKMVRFVGHVDPRTLQPLRVDMQVTFELRGETTTLMSFEFDWVP